MSLPSRREVLAWYNAVDACGPEDPQSLHLCSLVAARSREAYPVLVELGPDSHLIRTSKTGIRRVIERLKSAGWMHLSSYTTDSVMVEFTVPPEMVPVEFPGKWEARSLAGVP